MQSNIDKDNAKLGQGFITNKQSENLLPQKRLFDEFVMILKFHD